MQTEPIQKKQTSIEALIAVAARQEQIITKIAEAVGRGDVDATFKLACKLIKKNEHTT